MYIISNLPIFFDYNTKKMECQYLILKLFSLPKKPKKGNNILKND